jgi:hypothetical protein
MEVYLMASGTTTAIGTVAGGGYIFTKGFERDPLIKLHEILNLVRLRR